MKSKSRKKEVGRYEIIRRNANRVTVGRYANKARRTIREYQKVLSKMQKELDRVFYEVEPALSSEEFKNFKTQVGMKLNIITGDFELPPASYRDAGR